MKYLFIAGCARSGTSALTHLIGSHSKIILGMERYGHIVSPSNFSLTKEHFIKERFLNIQKDDTFYSSFEKFHSWDPNLIEKFGTHEYIGDKRPELYLVYDELYKKFDDPIILFIYRNIYEVAASWNDRAAKGDGWPSHKDFTKSIYSWVDSIQMTLKAIAKGYNVLPINYESLFIEQHTIKPIFDKLGIKIDDLTKEKYKNIIANSTKLVEERKIRQLSEEQVAYINAKCNTELYSSLDEYKII